MVRRWPTTIDPAGLQILKDSGQRIILAVPVNNEGGPNVARVHPDQLDG